MCEPKDVSSKAYMAKSLALTKCNWMRSKNRAGKKLEGRANVINPESLPIPDGGREKFDQYIKDSAAVILDSDGLLLQADMLLSFVLDKKGKPSKITVLQSNCEACEKEAIRLLKSGTKWIGKTWCCGDSENGVLNHLPDVNCRRIFLRNIKALKLSLLISCNILQVINHLLPTKEFKSDLYERLPCGIFDINL